MWLDKRFTYSTWLHERLGTHFTGLCGHPQPPLSLPLLSITAVILAGRQKGGKDEYNKKKSLREIVPNLLHMRPEP